MQSPICDDTIIINTVDKGAAQDYLEELKKEKKNAGLQLWDELEDEYQYDDYDQMIQMMEIRDLLRYMNRNE